MLRGILADIHVQGHFEKLVTYTLEGPELIGFWKDVDLVVETFESLGLDLNDPDDKIWRLCQKKNLILFTGNRNNNDETSLEAVMRNEMTDQSLPVITVSNVEQLRQSRTYARAVAFKLLDTIYDIEILRGTRRLYVP